MEYQEVNYVDSNTYWDKLWCRAWSLVCIANYSEIIHEYVKSPFNFVPFFKRERAGIVVR